MDFPHWQVLRQLSTGKLVRPTKPTPPPKRGLLGALDEDGTRICTHVHISKL